MLIVQPSFFIITPIDGEKILTNIERIGRTCYKSEETCTFRSATRFVRSLISKGHESVLEHESISVRIICDRGVSHEIVRHRIASYSQESTRYCNYTASRFSGHISLIHPKGLTDAQIARRESHYEAVQFLYDVEISEGVSPQIARGVLPTALKTEIVMTMNLREWRYFFKLRAVGIAGPPHPQMLEITIPLLKEFKQQIPVIFDDIKV